MEDPPLHARTVRLIHNLCTNHISPQFHVIYDNLFKTVHASASKPPASWPYLFTFSCFKSDFHNEEFLQPFQMNGLHPSSCPSDNNLEIISTLRMELTLNTASKCLILMVMN